MDGDEWERSGLWVMGWLGGGNLVGKFLLFKMFSVSSDSRICAPLLSACWFMY